MKKKEKTLGDFIFEAWNPIIQNLISSINPKGYVCDGCKKHFGLDELFRNYKDTKKWLCDSCLKKKERKNESRKNR